MVFSCNRQRATQPVGWIKLQLPLHFFALERKQNARGRNIPEVAIGQGTPETRLYRVSMADYTLGLVFTLATLTAFH